MESLCLEEKAKDFNKEVSKVTLPYFIVIKETRGKKVRIPCANKNVADKVASAYSTLSKKQPATNIPAVHY